MKYLGCLAFLLTAGCDGLPLRFPNDTARTVRMDDHGRNFPTPLQLEKIPPSETFGSRYCWKKTDAFFVATEAHPDPVVFDPKEFCDPDECDCEIPVSKLIKHMTLGGVVKRQQDVCAGRGPFLQPDIRAELCEAYVSRAVGRRATPSFSWELEALLRESAQGMSDEGGRTAQPSQGQARR